MSTVTDLRTVSTETEIVVDGELLWVSPGRNEHGRYWALSTPSEVPAGVVTEALDGSADAVVKTVAWHGKSVQEAACWVVAALRGELTCPCGCSQPIHQHDTKTKGRA
ncbi:hypothetical protein [Kitasatospora sp. NPDC086791]|uniref:hypothetical protein n=1 Tax=Kitasatospora sp. NPDC086791 TaxID=3155178 RepID=UPI003444FDFA